MQESATDTTRQAVRRVLWITLVLNLIVAAGKIIIGLWSGALAITADGFHSLVDGSSNIVALVANRIAIRPPDDDHPYGHRRFETLAALGIGAFLLVTAWEITSSALERLSGGSTPEITPLSFVVMLATLGVNVFVNRYESSAGRRLHSELLLADATHTRADISVTLAVLVSMGLVTAFGWTWTDTVAALVIVLLILRAAWDVLRQTGSVLVDTAPYSPRELTEWAAEAIPTGQVLRARSRGPADAAHVDIDVQVAPEMTADHTAAIADAIRDHLDQTVPGLAEVEVHFVPDTRAEPDYVLRARACADGLGLAVHEVHLCGGETSKRLEMHVEVPPGQTLAHAHAQVTRLEDRVCASLPDIAEVVTHIEPALLPTLHDAEGAQADTLKKRARTLLVSHYPRAGWHNLDVYPIQNHYALTIHVTLPAALTVEAAHDLAENAEILLRAELPQLERVTIHTEPEE
ncbi:MAG: cation-efflux pump [Anaerolineae bacterium]|nr:cation-efflux pump [Anaerolineae bacterium]